MKTAQWALDCRTVVPSKDEFLHMHWRDLQQMIVSARGFRARVLEAFRSNLSAIENNRCLLVRNADGISSDKRIPKHWGAPKLVLTSPPYRGIHILYHRWQVNGRRETPAPYWLAGCRDGNGAAYYTFGDRKRKDERYLKFLKSCFSSITSLLDNNSIVVQLVAFSDSHSQLPRYLQTMQEVGLEQLRLDELNQLETTICRSVPNRKWYADMKGDISASKEILLLHRRA